MSSMGSGGGAASGNAGLDKGRKLLESLNIGKVASQLHGQTPQQRLAAVMQQFGAQFPNPAAVQPGQMATLYGGGR